MIEALSVVSLMVRDQAEALDFYVNKLGFQQHSDFPMGPSARWVSVMLPAQPNQQIVFVHPESWRSDPAQIQQELELVGRNVTWSFTTSDCQATYEELTSRGVKFQSPPTDQFYGIEAVFEDLYGNTFSLLQPKPMPQY